MTVKNTLRARVGQWSGPMRAKTDLLGAAHDHCLRPREFCQKEPCCSGEINTQPAIGATAADIFFGDKVIYAGRNILKETLPG